MTIRFCRVCKDFHPLEEPWPERCYGHFRANSGTESIQIIHDIQPYQAVVVDKITGKPPKIGSRREHREFLKRNGYVERGNEPIKARPVIDAPDSHRDIKRTLDHFRSQGRWK